MKDCYSFLSHFLLFVLMTGLTPLVNTLNAQQIFVVNSAADTPDDNINDNVCADLNGNCSLRAALENANKTSAKDEVHFNIPGVGPHTIVLHDDLPPVIEKIVLDASTQPGYSWSSPQVVIDGNDLALNGFRLEGQSAGSTITGFVMSNFDIMAEDDLLANGAAIYADSTGGHHIKANYLGIAADGFTPFPNVFGLALVNSSNNLIGGTTAEERNVISGNFIKKGWGVGILISEDNSHSNNIQGNFVGTDADGFASRSNYWGIVT